MGLAGRRAEAGERVEEAEAGEALVLGGWGLFMGVGWVGWVAGGGGQAEANRRRGLGVPGVGGPRLFPGFFRP